ncbi:MAG: hypothetical protein P8M34_13005, partial [Saprospiraceae bacterium]|nr:hypothetical protein [Saprospiraceae bacterium]
MKRYVIKCDSSFILHYRKKFNIKENKKYAYDSLTIAGFMLFLGILEAFGGLYHHSKRTKDDWWIELLSFVHSSTVSKPLIVVVSAFILGVFLTEYEGVFTETPMWISLPFVLLIYDLFQYLYHRKAHERKWLWNLHRPHHLGHEMGVLVT